MEDLVLKLGDLLFPLLQAFGGLQTPASGGGRPSFFRVRYDRLTPAETRFLRAMAKHGTGPNRTSDIADTLGVKVTSLGPVRARLINKGMIYSPAYGDLAFTVPLFDQFMIRSLPSFER